MKKTLALLLALVLIMSLAACSNSQGSQSESKPESKVESEAASSQQSSAVDETKQSATEKTDSQSSSANSKEASDGDIVDVDALKAIEEKDTCKVKITKKEIQEDANTGISAAGDDLILLHVTNNDSKDVSKVTVYVLAYDNNNAAQVLKTGTFSLSNGEKYVKALTTSDDLVIEPGETKEVALKTTKGSISGVRCIVASYEMDGKEIKNDLVEDWYKGAYVGKNQELD